MSTTTSLIQEYEKEYLFVTPEDLRFLLTTRAIFQRHRGIRLRLNELDQESTIPWENKINRYYKACGCSEGKFFVLLAFVIFFVVSFMQNDLAWNWTTVGTGFLYCLTGAFIGKLVGKIVAYVNFRKTVKELSMQLM